MQRDGSLILEQQGNLCPTSVSGLLLGCFKAEVTSVELFTRCDTNSYGTTLYSNSVDTYWEL
jgi:hypothetical protein